MDETSNHRAALRTGAAPRNLETTSIADTRKQNLRSTGLNNCLRRKKHRIALGKFNTLALLDDVESEPINDTIQPGIKKLHRNILRKTEADLLKAPQTQKYDTAVCCT